MQSEEHVFREDGESIATAMALVMGAQRRKRSRMEEERKQAYDNAAEYVNNLVRTGELQQEVTSGVKLSRQVKRAMERAREKENK